jgi:hypothetical protein
LLPFLEVNTTTGQVRLKNQTGETIPIDYYEVTSTSGALKPTTWSSLQDQNLAGFPAGNGSGNGWEEAGGSSAKILSESFLAGNSGVATGASIGLGTAYQTGGAHDLVFRYSAVPPATLSADFDSDGDADGADFLAWQRGFGATTGATKAQGDANSDGAVNADDLALWKAQFGGAGSAGPGVLTTGFVRYVTSFTIAAVPEPTSCLLASVAIVGLGIARRRA